MNSPQTNFEQNNNVVNSPQIQQDIDFSQYNNTPNSVEGNNIIYTATPNENKITGDSAIYNQVEKMT